MNSKVKAELNTLQQSNKGLLDPVKVVAFARNKATALHKCFTWDNTKAAQEYRIWEARQLIRVHVVMLPQAPQTPVRAWVSMRGDRGKGGYRRIEDVMNDASLRASMLEQAAADMELFQQKYGVLDELGDIFAAMEQTRRKIGGNGKRRRKAA